jgi:hypothetical protein
MTPPATYIRAVPTYRMCQTILLVILRKLNPVIKSLGRE